MLSKFCDKNCHNCKLAIENKDLAYHDGRVFDDPEVIVVSPYYECPCSRGTASIVPSTSTVPCAKCIYAKKVILPYSYPHELTAKMSYRQRKAIANTKFHMECIKCTREPEEVKTFRTPNSRCTEGIERETPLMDIDKVPVNKEDCYTFN